MDEAERIAAFYRKHGVEPPKVFKHGTEDEIRQNLERQRPSKWWLEGNELKGETSLGIVTQQIPTDMILTGTDDQGLPIFKKVVLS
jgi:hypothetical protein